MGKRALTLVRTRVPPSPQASQPPVVLADLPDEALLKAHVAGDPAAFGILVNRHQNQLWSVVFAATRNVEDAADCLQDALIRAYRTAADFRGDSAVGSWLHRIAFNASMDHLRRRNSRPSEQLTPAHEELAAVRDEFSDTDTRLAVRSALMKLPPEQATALILVDIEGYSVVEAAREMGVATGTIKSRCNRGRLRLAVLLGHLNPSVGSDSSACQLVDSR